VITIGANMPLFHKLPMKKINEAVTQMNVVAIELQTGKALKNVFLELWKEGFQ
jgi:hypothetical protein